MEKPPTGLNSRDRILWAAARMLGEDPGSALSVRAVAARAEVSTGSLRHHFPTQRKLMDTVLGMLYDMAMPHDDVGDPSLPARDRLLGCLQQLLAPEMMNVTPREGWIMAFDRYIRTEPTHEVGEEYLAIERGMRHRIEYCLSVLEAEGALAPGDNARRANLLMTVINGLSIAQALPAEESRLQVELEVLYTAVDWTLNDGPALPDPQIS